MKIKGLIGITKGNMVWDHWAHCGIFENGVLLMYTLEGVSSVANFITAYENKTETPIFNL